MVDGLFQVRTSLPGPPDEKSGQALQRGFLVLGSPVFGLRSSDFPLLTPVFGHPTSDFPLPLFLKYKIHSQNQKHKANGMVPFKGFVLEKE